jgi:putative lipoprotein
MNFRIAWRAALALALCSLVLQAGSAIAKTRSLTGTVTYRERIALPPDAVLEVRLLDVSLADAPSVTIAKTTTRLNGQVPFRYRLRYNDTKIKPRHRYAVSAQIFVDRKLWFVTATQHPVFGDGGDETDIVVQRAGNAGDADTGRRPTGRWLAEDIAGRGVIDNLQTVLEIAPDGAVSGSGGCNRISGKATISGQRIRFSPIASTFMACPPAAMDQEQKFLAALERVRGWRIDPRRQKLILLSRGGRPLVVLARN